MAKIVQAIARYRINIPVMVKCRFNRIINKIIYIIIINKMIKIIIKIVRYRITLWLVSLLTTCNPINHLWWVRLDKATLKQESIMFSHSQLLGIMKVVLSNMYYIKAMLVSKTLSKYNINNK